MKGVCMLFYIVDVLKHRVTWFFIGPPISCLQARHFPKRKAATCQKRQVSR